MDSKNSSKKRLALTFLPLLVLAVILALLISLDQARSYKEITIQSARLYVPKTFLRDEQTDVVGMLRDLIGTFERNSYQFSAYADEILPAATVRDDHVANSSVIWTIAPAGHQGSITGNFVESTVGSMVADDTALLMGLPPFQNRLVSQDTATGLYKLRSTESDGRTYAYSNVSPTAANDGPAWVAHCVELSSLSEGSPWGRCTQQFETGDLLVQIHFDGRLIADTSEVTSALLALINTWRTEP